MGLVLYQRGIWIPGTELQNFGLLYGIYSSFETLKKHSRETWLKDLSEIFPIEKACSMSPGYALDVSSALLELPQGRGLFCKRGRWTPVCFWSLLSKASSKLLIPFKYRMLAYHRLYWPGLATWRPSIRACQLNWRIPLTRKPQSESVNWHLLLELWKNGTRQMRFALL